MKFPYATTKTDAICFSQLLRLTRSKGLDVDTGLWSLQNGPHHQILIGQLETKIIITKGKPNKRPSLSLKL